MAFATMHSRLKQQQQRGWTKMTMQSDTRIYNSFRFAYLILILLGIVIYNLHHPLPSLSLSQTHKYTHTSPHYPQLHLLHLTLTNQTLLHSTCHCRSQTCTTKSPIMRHQNRYKKHCRLAHQVTQQSKWKELWSQSYQSTTAASSKKILIFKGRAL